MSDFRTCETCKRYVSARYPHTCDPEWSCALAEYADDPEEYVNMRAVDPGAAAEELARVNDDEPRDGAAVEVVVRDGDRLRRFKVLTSFSVDYNAREVEPAEEST